MKNNEFDSLLRPPPYASGAWLTSTTFFDEKLRPIQVQSTNARGQQDVATTRYDFAGNVLSRYATHEGPNHAPVTVREQSRYDHAGRLLETTQALDALDGQAPTPLARFTYNELGQVAQKKLGPGVDGLQAVDYRYHIRGWLTDVNDVAQPDARPVAAAPELRLRLRNPAVHRQPGRPELALR